MTRIGLFCGSTTGNTKDAATQIRTAFGDDIVTVASIAGATAEDVNPCVQDMKEPVGSRSRDGSS